MTKYLLIADLVLEIAILIFLVRVFNYEHNQSKINDANILIHHQQNETFGHIQNYIHEMRKK